MQRKGKGGGSRGAAAGNFEAWQSPEAFVRWSEELLELEQEAENEETTELLQTCTHAELQARGIAILKLSVGEQSTALYGRTCLSLERPGSSPLPAHRITHGDIVGIFDQTSRPLSKAVPLATAVVQKLRPSAIDLAFDGEVPAEVLDGRQLNIATVSSDVTMKRYKEALDMLKSPRMDGPAAGLVAVCFNDGEVPRFHEPKSELCGRADAVDCAFRAEQTHRLNEPQKAAVVKALCAVDVAVVHGPPGTGKTTTLVSYILEAVYRKQRLLVTAPSNVAVDNLLERVVDAGFRSVVRLGHPARIASDLHRYSMDNVVYASEQAALCRDIKKEIEDALKKPKSKGETKASRSELGELRKELRQRERRAVAEVLRRTQVVFATCAGAATLHREIRRGGVEGCAGSLEFDVVVIDEAAQALEVACWIPLLLGKKAVLAGDHQQLAATVKSTKAQQRGLDRTLFARLIDRFGDDVAALLSIQYRMNSVIMGWSSSSFYGSRLEAADSVADRTLQLNEVPALNLVGEILEAMRSPLLFVDTGGLTLYREEGQDAAVEVTKGQGAAVHQSRSNPGESRFLVHYAKLLVQGGLSPRDLTVITPYNRQVERLRADFAEDTECSKLGLERPRVNTVDSFQGQEADAVLISLVRSNDRSVVGFLADFRRLNVAVTRARKHVMLVGDAATIGSDKMLGSLYDYACEHGKVVYVQQLLDESGGVPPDPSSVTLTRAPGAAKRFEQDRSKRLTQAEDEAKLRSRFEEQLQGLALEGGRLELPASLNPFERAIAHEVAKSLGLSHESVGEGSQRRLCVWRAGEEANAAQQAAKAQQEAAQAHAKQKGAVVAGKGPASSSSSKPKPVKAEVEEEEETETVLEAFQRRAAALMDSLKSNGPVAEWKAASDEAVEILHKLAAARGLELQEEGSGKRRRCFVLPPEAPEEAPFEPPARTEAPPQPAASSSENSMLGGLHAERLRRQAQAAEQRKAANAAAQAELKVAKKAGKEKSGAAAAAAAGDDDLDALLAEFSSQDGVCGFGTCREKVNTLVDVLSKCKYCEKRFCLKHAQAELHGCGDAAQRGEQKQWRQTCEAAMRPNGAALVNKSVGEKGRNQLANKLQEKLKDQETARSAKKKDKK